MRTFILRFLLIASLFTKVTPLIHHLEIRNDNRAPAFRIETFGFYTKGLLNLTVTNFNIQGVQPEGDKLEEGRLVGFLIRHTETDTSAFFEETEVVECQDLIAKAVVDNPEYKILTLDPPKWEKLSFEMEITESDQGFFTVDFINCYSGEPAPAVNFDLYLTMVNPGPSYLSAGRELLPTIYTMFVGCYVIAIGMWCVACYRDRDGKKVYLVHHLMTGFLSVKLLSLFFKAIEYHYISATGYPGGWAVAYFFFTFLKGIMMFTVIALIGTGWTFVKPFLSDKDKKIFLVVIPLQDIFRLVDIICCGAILIPIIWSIKHLKDVADMNDKAKRAVQKLQLFRHFYLLVVCYIYFTRIVVLLLDATLPYTMEWFGDFCTETATITFWVITGYLFRPVEDNPYLRVHISDLETESEDEEITRMEELDDL